MGSKSDRKPASLRTAGADPTKPIRAARSAAETAAKDAQEGIGLVSINKFDLLLWRKFVGLARMQGKTIPQAADEALRLWIKQNIRDLDI
jgi:hypothetical protein